VIYTHTLGMCTSLRCPTLTPRAPLNNATEGRKVNPGPFADENLVKYHEPMFRHLVGKTETAVIKGGDVKLQVDFY